MICNPQAADIVFAIDQSANIPPQDLYKIGVFIDRYMEYINGSQGASGLGLVRIGLILFSSDVKVFSSQYLNGKAMREYGYVANFLEQALLSEQNVTDFNR